MIEGVVFKRKQRKAIMKKKWLSFEKGNSCQKVITV